jgi:hypothetical protein
MRSSLVFDPLSGRDRADLHAACPVWVDVGHEACSLEPFEAVELEDGRLFYEARWYDPGAMLLKDGLTRWIATSVSGHDRPRRAARAVPTEGQVNSARRCTTSAASRLRLDSPDFYRC